MTRGGKREGAGRPALLPENKKYKVNFWITLKEKELVRGFINSIRNVIINNESEETNEET